MLAINQKIKESAIQRMMLTIFAEIPCIISEKISLYCKSQRNERSAGFCELH